MIRVLLSKQRLPAQQRWWWNFLHGTDKRTAPSTAEERMDVVNLELLNWSAQIWHHRQKGAVSPHYRSYLDFYDEQAYAWFLLRWS
mgnify:CR=1 FL=1